jgi:undecaprenyl-diphosphatase
MTYLDTIILGVIEGLTEFIPVSSTGHLILASSLLQIPESAFLSTFEVVIQFGAILAVLILFWREFLDIAVLQRIIVAFIPTGIIGYALYHFIKGYLLGNDTVVVWALALGGIAIILIEWFRKGTTTEEADIRSLTYKQCLLIGLAQALAVIPGVSRSGATVMGGLLMKIPRATIFKFSFLLAVPTMLAAAGLDLLKSHDALTSANMGTLVLGSAIAFGVAFATLRAAMRFVRKSSFTPFGIYRIIAAVIFWLILFA